MSAVYENDEHRVCIQLSKNDYVYIYNTDKSAILKIISKDGKLVIKNIEEKKNQNMKITHGLKNK